MASQEHKLCLTTKLPSEYRMSLPIHMEYMLNIKPLILSVDNVTFRKCEDPKYVAGEIYGYIANISWNKDSHSVENALLEELERNVSMLVGTVAKKLGTFLYNIQRSNDRNEEVIYTGIHAFCNHSMLDEKTNRIKLYFPSVKVSFAGFAEISVVLQACSVED
jgi:hypothetical protein